MFKWVKGLYFAIGILAIVLWLVGCHYKYSYEFGWGKEENDTEQTEKTR